MNHIVDTCPLTKFEGGLNLLHKADDDAVIWLKSTVTAHTHTHTHLFNGPLSRTTRVSRYQKGKPICILLKQETVSGSDIRWAICKCAPHSRQITTPAPHHSVFTGWMPFLPPNQQYQSTEGTYSDCSTREIKVVLENDAWNQMAPNCLQW